MSRRRFGSVRRLQSGRWQARYYLPDGTRRSPAQRFATKTDALRFLATVEADLLCGTFRLTQAPSQTVATWAARHIAAQTGRLTPKTQALYESLLRSCIEPRLGAVPIAEEPTLPLAWDDASSQADATGRLTCETDRGPSRCRAVWSTGRERRERQTSAPQGTRGAS